MEEILFAYQLIVRSILPNVIANLKEVATPNTII